MDAKKEQARSSLSMSRFNAFRSIRHWATRPVGRLCTTVVVLAACAILNNSCSRNQGRAAVEQTTRNRLCAIHEAILLGALRSQEQGRSLDLSDTLRRSVAFHGKSFLRWDAGSGDYFNINPSIKKWMAPDSFSNEVAVCTPASLPVGDDGRKSYLAVTFDGAVVRLLTPPGWESFPVESVTP